MDERISLKQGKKSKAAGRDFVEEQNNFYQNTNFKPLRLQEAQKISVLKPNLLFRIFLYNIPLSILLFSIGFKIFNYFDIYFNLFTVPAFFFTIALLLSTYVLIYLLSFKIKYFRDTLFLFEHAIKLGDKIVTFDNVQISQTFFHSFHF